MHCDNGEGERSEGHSTYRIARVAGVCFAFEAIASGHSHCVGSPLHRFNKIPCTYARRAAIQTHPSIAAHSRSPNPLPYHAHIPSHFAAIRRTCGELQLPTTEGDTEGVTGEGADDGVVIAVWDDGGVASGVCEGDNVCVPFGVPECDAPNEAVALGLGAMTAAQSPLM